MIGILKSKHDQMPWVNKVDVWCVQRWRNRARIHFDRHTHKHMSGNSIRFGSRLLTTYNASWLCIPHSKYRAFKKPHVRCSVSLIPSEHNMRRCKMFVPKPTSNSSEKTEDCINSKPQMHGIYKQLFRGRKRHIGKKSRRTMHICILALTLLFPLFLPHFYFCAKIVWNDHTAEHLNHSKTFDRSA